MIPPRSEGADDAVGRKARLFFGSDDHAQSAANRFSLIASCQLHDVDAEVYLADVIRVLPYWPRDRYLELAPSTGPRPALASPAAARATARPVTVPPAGLGRTAVAEPNAHSRARGCFTRPASSTTSVQAARTVERA